MVVSRGFVITLGLVVGVAQARAQPHHRKHRIHAEPVPTTIAPEPQLVALVAPAPELDEPELTASQAPPSARGWQFELGPYVWASNVDVDVDLGPISAGANIGFVKLVQHASYGFEGLGELRNGHFLFSGDVVYGAASVSTSPSIATITATASMLLTDALAGYEVLGSQDTWFSIEARAGVRYQRTAIGGELDTLGIMLTTKDIVASGSDAIAGGRVVLRPTRWLALSGAADTGVVGNSQSTWSVSADASVRVSSAIRLSAGWRTLSIDRSNVDLELSGPRVAGLYRF